MLMLLKFTIWICVAFYSVSCTPGIKPVSELNGPIDARAFTLTPPQGDGWKYRELSRQGAYQVQFVKIQSRTYSIVAYATETPSYATFSSPEEFLYFIEKGIEIKHDPNRYKDWSNRVVLDEKFGEMCVKYNTEYMDHGAVNSSTPLKLRALGYLFIPQNNKDMVIDIAFSDRGNNGELSSSFYSDAEQFFNGLTVK